MFKKIAVALDGSEHAERAIPVAIELAERHQAEIEFIHVDELVVGKAAHVSIHADEPETVAAIRRRAEELEARGLKVSVVVKESVLGGPARAIADAAEETGADLIVAGRRGHSPIAGLLLGGVTQRLLQVAHQPVLVVPHES